MTSGSCLCGTVRFEADTIERMTHCHCSMCRKAHGAAYATYAHCPTAGFRWTAGEDSIERLEASLGFHRAFCRQCGSALPDGDTEAMHVPAGLFDDDPGVRPSAHIFAASKAPWQPIGDALPSHDAWRPGVEAPVIDRPVPETPGDAVLHGSCLCGAVAYEIVEPLKAVHNCHCSRCRKARAAPFTTNGFTPMSGVRFVRGEDEIAHYKIPEARFFTVAFCRHCGSGVPRLDPLREIAVIPFGSLDDDPGRGAEDHIYVGSASPWHTIEDDLPQFDERPPG